MLYYSRYIQIQVQAKQDNKFTPGEWTTNYSSFGVVIFNDQCQRIANIPANNPNSVADAELIAAAPELLAALDDLVEFLDRSYVSHAPTAKTLIKNANSVIAKARGVQ